MITITEGLAEINLIKKQIQNKKNTIKQLVFTKSHMDDPHQSEGGSKSVFKRENQSLGDLRKRLCSIRSEISKANLNNNISICGIEKTIFDWLTWKREVYEEERQSLVEIYTSANRELNEEKARPQVVRSSDGEDVIVVKTVLNCSLDEIKSEVERIDEIHGKLDGQLSLKNATITINI